jgi:hypothetical protein
MTVEDQLIKDALAREDEAMELAGRQVFGFEPLSKLPVEVPLRLISDYRHLLSSRKLSRDEMSFVVQRDLRQATAKLRGMTLNMEHLNSVHLSVLLHVAVLVGVEKLAKMGDLWAALREKRFEDAADALLYSEWPLIVAGDPTTDDKRRVVELLRMMRTGLLPTTLSANRPH